MLEILFSPSVALTKAKKEKNYGMTILVLLLASLLTSVNLFIFTKSFSGKMIENVIIVFIHLFLYTVLAAVLLNLAVSVLAGKKGYFEALTALSYGFFAVSIGLLVFFLISLIPASGYLAMLINLISVAILMLAIAAGNAITFKAVKDFYQLDFLVVLIAVWIVYIAVFFAMYLLLLKSILAPMLAMMGG